MTAPRVKLWQVEKEMEIAEYPDDPGPDTLGSSGEQETLFQIRKKATAIPNVGLLSSPISPGKEFVLKQEQAKTHPQHHTHWNIVLKK